MDSECSVLILSCDKNIGVLTIFLNYFRKHWKNCSFPVYVGLESLDRDLENVTVLLSEEISWSKRVKNYLNIIHSEYIMLILDDFIIEETVQEKQLLEYLNIMKLNHQIANICFAELYDDRNISTEFKNLVERRKNADYLLNMQAGIWRKQLILQLLKDNESPWQTELYGSVRARKLKDYRFLCLDKDENMPLKYNRGWLVVRGVWNGKEIKRLGLEQFGNCIFDGKNVIYHGFGKLSFYSRIIRRMNIFVRQAFSWMGIYL